MTKTGSQSISRALALFAHIVEDNGATPAAALAGALGLAPSTARRLLKALEEQGMIMRIARGRYAGGDRLRRLADQVNPHHRIIEAARPILRRLALRIGGTAHLGILDDDMVTYLVKEGERAVFTREREQLEAYCTGIGKALLAQLPSDRLEAYLRVPFVRLTPQTVTEPASLRVEIERTRVRGHAIDDREMAEDLACVAVPLHIDGAAPLAISLSGDPVRMSGISAPKIAEQLNRCTQQIAAHVLRTSAKHSPMTTGPDRQSSPPPSHHAVHTA
jgi:IclR family transcriptional regulator, acetate operon repressor